MDEPPIIVDGASGDAQRDGFDQHRGHDRRAGEADRAQRRDLDGASADRRVHRIQRAEERSQRHDDPHPRGHDIEKVVRVLRLPLIVIAFALDGNAAIQS